MIPRCRSRDCVPDADVVPLPESGAFDWAVGARGVFAVAMPFSPRHRTDRHGSWRRPKANGRICINLEKPLNPSLALYSETGLEGSSVCASMLAPHHPFQGRPRHRDPAGAEVGCRPGASGLPGSLDALPSCAVGSRKSIAPRRISVGWALRRRTLGSYASTRSTSPLVSNRCSRKRDPDR